MSETYRIQEHVSTHMNYIYCINYWIFSGYNSTTYDIPLGYLSLLRPCINISIMTLLRGMGCEPVGSPGTRSHEGAFHSWSCRDIWMAKKSMDENCLGTPMDWTSPHDPEMSKSGNSPEENRNQQKRDHADEQWGGLSILQEFYLRPAAFCSLGCCTMNANMCGLLPHNCWFVLVMIEKYHDLVIHVIHHPMERHADIQPPFLIHDNF